jgi:hypothetical protein
VSVVLRGFVTPWARWTERWFDLRMQPAKSPLWLADCAKEGVFVGPFVDPQGRVRDEVVFYPKLADAQRELNLRPTDFAPWAAWLKGSLVGEGAEELRMAFAERIEEALAHLRVKGGGKAYIRAIVPIGLDLVKAIGDLRAAPPILPPEFEAKLAERDRFVDREAQERMRLVGKARGAN